MIKKILLFMCVLFICSSHSHAEDTIKNMVEEYYSMIVEKTQILTKNIDEQSNEVLMLDDANSTNVSLNFDGLINYIEGLILEIRSLEAIQEIYDHRQLFLEYLETYKVQFQAMTNLNNLENMKIVEETTLKLEIIYAEMNEAEEKLCKNYELKCDE